MADTRPVAVVTSVNDTTSDFVITELHTRGVPVVRFDLADIAETMTISAMFGSSPLSGQLTTPSRTLNLTEVRSLYWRRPSLATYPHMSEQDAQFAKAQNTEALRGVLGNLPNCLYVNHPDANGEADYKPRQLACAIELGMSIPETLITNSLADAHTFLDTHPQAVYKPLLCTDYQHNGEPVTIWTAPVTADELDNRVQHTMHMFQAKAPKAADWRITIVGDDIFCVQIESDQLDWRRDYARNTYTVVTPPDQLVKQMHAYLDRFGLVFGCFDFGITSEGEPVFFECNPNGQWGWLEPPTGLRITQAFASTLQKGIKR